jgi:hypothetical protein
MGGKGQEWFMLLPFIALREDLLIEALETRDWLYLQKMPCIR